mgnify:FL=1
MRWPWIVAVVVLGLDQATKWLVQQALVYGESIPVLPPVFNLVRAHNEGVAFGMLSGAGGWQIPLLLVVTTGVVIALGVWLARLGRRETGTRLALALILGGAVGNLIDRARFGHVVDFLDFHWREVYHYPAFNVADSGITVGAVILIGVLIREERAERRGKLR